jgi:hypothetical protein
MRCWQLLWVPLKPHLNLARANGQMPVIEDIHYAASGFLSLPCREVHR